MTVVKNDNGGQCSTVAVNSLKFFHLGKALSAKGITLASKMIHDVSELFANGILELDLSGPLFERCPFVFSTVNLKDFKQCEPS